MKHIILALHILLIASYPSRADESWLKVRERAMELSEQGRAQEAYISLSLFTSTEKAAGIDHEFYQGFLSYINGWNQRALVHFTNMISSIDGEKNADTIAKGYFWRGFVKRQTGNPSLAETDMYKASLAGHEYYSALARQFGSYSHEKRFHSDITSKFPYASYLWKDKRVPLSLLLAVIWQESRFNVTAVSPAGALGLMQVMPATARDIVNSVGSRLRMDLLAGNGDYNVAIGSKYLGDLLTYYNGNMMLAIAAYNAGRTNVDDWITRFGDPRVSLTAAIIWCESIPFKETRGYVQKVLAAYVIYKGMSKMVHTSPPSNSR
ncbi:lytic transglycosylase domain-containing protein [Flexibacterium corallicola]|uniref:lytic transglycosylase domain-containing protein n=1 Tax=Flexibacterium corallicola TaxID=3037259 RepID=UPI00286EC854|nr:lytic transglycosylase domain-containing protein [Pseudovibrio sp. M1P-2-3]